MSKKLTAWRAVHPDLRSSNGFRWPFPGKKAVAPLPAGSEFSRGNPCPEFVGDGLCLAKTWRGAASGGIPAITCLEVTYRPEHVLGEDADKVRPVEYSEYLLPYVPHSGVPLTAVRRGAVSGGPRGVFSRRAGCKHVGALSTARA